MHTIFTLFFILISSDAIFGLNRMVRTTRGVTTEHVTTDRNAVADYISQKIKGIERATEFSGNPNLSVENVPKAGSGISFGSPSGTKTQQKQSGSITPGQYYNNRPNPSQGPIQALQANQANPLVMIKNQKNGKDDSTQQGINNVKQIMSDQGRTLHPSSQKPDGYAMRISAESVEIDATIDTSNETENLQNGNWSRLWEEDNENGYYDLGEVSDAEKNQQRTEKTEIEGEDLSAESATTMDPVDEEIKHVLDALPKLPDLTFSNNSTRFVFHKDPEEAALDDRITQVARQLAETSLRRHYEEQKLGHYIPIRLQHFDEEYPPNMFTPARKLNSNKVYSNALEILRQIQQPQVRFRALSVPQHIYNRPFYRSNDESLQSKKKLEFSNSPETVYVTEAEENTRMAVAPMFNPNGFGAIVQLGPHYVLPIPKVSLEQNRIPLLFGITQAKPVQSFHNHNDINTYSYREVA